MRYFLRFYRTQRNSSRIIVKSPHPPDATASEYLRSKKYIGSKERKFISAATFAALRLKLLAEKGAESGPANSGKRPAARTRRIALRLSYRRGIRCIEAGSPAVSAAYRDGDVLNIRELCALTLVERCSFSVESAAAWVETAAEFLHTAIAADDAGEITDEAAQSVAMPQWILEDWAEAVGVRSNPKGAGNAAVGAGRSSGKFDDDFPRKSAGGIGKAWDCIASGNPPLSPDALLLDERVNIYANAVVSFGRD